MIRLHNITKKFNQNKDEIIALKDINLFIGKGEWINILGPSGSGKTTLLNLIGGMDAPTAGTITVGESTVRKREKTVSTQLYRVYFSRFPPASSIYGFRKYDAAVNSVSTSWTKGKSDANS